MTFDTPEALFQAARVEILHQDDALRALCVPLFYHLKYKAHSQVAQGKQVQKVTKVSDDFFEQMSQAFGLGDELKRIEESVKAQGGKVTAVQISVQELGELVGDDQSDGKSSDRSSDGSNKSDKSDDDKDGQAQAHKPYYSPHRDTPALQVYEPKQAGSGQAQDDCLLVNFPYPDFDQMRAALHIKPLAKAPLFVTGKTGSGKTHLIKTLCQLAGINFIMVNATHLSNAGYKGMTLADVGELLVKQAGSEREALYSVVFFDEFDKLFVANATSIQDWHRALATEMLTIIEGASNFPVKDSTGIPSRHMLFILGGSFTMHQDTAMPIGFTTKSETISPDEQMNLTKLGLPDELAGRIGRMIGLKELAPHELAEILIYSPSSPFVALAEQLALMNSTVGIEQALIDELVEREREAIEKFGVRGLYQGFYKLKQVDDVLAYAASHPYHHFVINRGEQFFAEYRSEYKPKPPPPRFEIKVPPKKDSEPPKKEPILDPEDDMPF